MNFTPRLLVAAVLGSSVVGGTVGALATAAATSQASPQAIATAIQRVSDQTAERELRVVDLDLKALGSGQDAAAIAQARLQTTTEAIDNNAAVSCFALATTNRSDCKP
jgi:ribosomal protein S11